MIYRSNLTCPDLTPHFKHLTVRPMAHSFGHSVPSDWADKADDDPIFGIYKRCGLWTHDEAAILFNTAMFLGSGVDWLDIGAHTGWTTRHIMAADVFVDAIEPMLAVPEFGNRFFENTDGEEGEALDAWTTTSQDFFEKGMALTPGVRYSGACIDGDHEPGKPLEDAQNSWLHLDEQTGVIILHDFIGQPVREAVTWLMDHGFNARVYYTPHMIGLCWRGDFVPPDHVPDPELVKQLQPHLAAMTDFDFTRLE